MLLLEWPLDDGGPGDTVCLDFRRWSAAAELPPPGVAVAGELPSKEATGLWASWTETESALLQQCPINGYYSDEDRSKSTHPARKILDADAGLE